MPHDANPITVRLAGKLVKLTLTPLQLRAVDVAVRRSGASSLSAWVRDVAGAAAGEDGDLELAAGFTGLPLSAWVREVVVSAASASPLRSQLRRARSWQKHRYRDEKAKRREARSRVTPRA